MGTIKQGILGGFSGKVGGVVGSSWKGIATMKAMPLSVANPQTAAQVNNRTQFKAVAQFASDLLTSLVKPLWDRWSIRMSGFNSFIRKNKDAFDTSGDIILADFVISQGILTGLVDLEYVKPSNGLTAFTFNWGSDVPSGKGAATDKVYILVYNKTQDNFIVDSGTVTRADETKIVNLPTAVVTGDDLGAYICPLQADGREVGPQGLNVSIVEE